MKHHATMSRIHLELARTAKYPEGSANHGYHFIAPLTAEGHVDLDTWRQNKDACTVTRFWANTPNDHGRLLHLRGGWCFDYGEGEPEDEEPFYKLDRHTFAPGTYVTITERDGKQYPFKVMAVVPAINPG
jgi:hypothetical protein